MDPSFPHPDLWNDVTSEVVRATRAAIDATSSAYTADAGTDVDARLRTELEQRGVEVGSDEWLALQARLIREGRSGQPDDPAAGVRTDAP